MLIYANPSTRPARRRATKKGASTMKRKRTTRRRATSRRRTVTKNPTIRRRRRTHRNPGVITRTRRSIGTSARGILGELASKDGLMLLGAAAIAPTAVDFVAEKVVPAQYQSGWTGLLAKAAIAGAAVWAIDKFLKQRKAALGFAVGSGASLLAQAVKMYRVGQAMPSAPPAVADEIARNPALFEQVVRGDFSSLNGYDMTPSVGGYDLTPGVAGEYDSMN